MTALSAFNLLLKCVKARRADGGGLGYAYHKQVSEKDAALDAAIEQLASELRRILTPNDDDKESDDG